MRQSFLKILAILTVFSMSTHWCFAQTNPDNSTNTQTQKIEKLKNQVKKIGTGGEITVVNLSNEKVYGSVSYIGTDSFQIVDVDSREILSFNYNELKKIHRGDGERNLITGKRKNSRRGWIFAAALLGTLAVILAVGLSDKDF